LTVGQGCLVNTYAYPALYSQVIAVLTNTMTTAPYRGGSRPEPLFVVETLIDKAARELGIDPAELRRRNTIPASAMPYTTPARQVYDCGDFVRNLDECVEKAGYAGAAQRKAAARARGKVLGVGVAAACAPSGGQGYEHVDLRFDPSGGVTLVCGSMDHGQGHGTTFKQILSERLGVDPKQIRYRYGETDVVAAGIGTFGSRSAILAGSDIVVAAERIVDKGRRIAAHLLEAAADDIVFDAGKFKITGTDRSVDIAEVARQSFHAQHVPKGMEVGLSAQSNWGDNTTATYACGVHICEVELDPETGRVALVRYGAVDDVGTVLNPLLCDGQMYGGIGQGAGQALVENLVYDLGTGQLLTGSFMDYCMPRADDFCDMELAYAPVPTKKNPLGVKGAGEAGTVSALPAIVNAVNDALAQLGAPPVSMPTTPEKVWRAIRAGASG
jgi:carbon-monoxide dehydrogenase large subunit